LRGQCSLQTTFFSLVYNIPRKQFLQAVASFCWKVHLAGAVSLGPSVLSEAGIYWPSHTRDMLGPPPHNGGAYMLFLRLSKAPHRSFFRPYLSQSCCCLRCKIGFNISSTLVNFQGGMLPPFLIFSSQWSSL
jgi:hypothetical protein